jgi:hypothetical protein
LTGTSCDLFVCEASFFGMLCAWREVRILRQQMCPEMLLSLVAYQEVE